ncbi:aminotransferase class V-fold PLP-dependent enzyme [Fulvivirga sp. M361]|uniref:aminotransferase class V-fold PLP-dependent enzyme n=1 Tax=Fulvivirga sp. M361 TaxID=2594266 RepID=UPI00117ACA66|nr:aminotransferase class V-fold PLP-dependent enzyme [Fulvivirga sp. M361]TRX47995.1 aminotransferase class V-fold PLP-dependent enzyme [Fulvivirga sp. M361]
MISFYPGPSRVDDHIPEYVQEACKKGIVSINHRSDEFMSLYRRTVKLLKKKLKIPEDYNVIFLSSATECWEVIAQSVVQGLSYHFYNGAFGEKWFEYTRKLNNGAIGYRFGMNLLLKTGELDLSEQPGVICLTQNETSNGTQIQTKQFEKLRAKYPEHILAVDATSSMAGIELEFKTADIWYASVQKCFGLPAGLAVMICSPKAIEWARTYDERDHYNSLPRLLDMMEKHQTTCTPNVLGIYLMMRVMESRPKISVLEKSIIERYNKYITLLEEVSLSHLISQPEARSFTVIPVKGDEDYIANIKSKAKKKGIVLGNGYGEYKDTTFRIANFPAITNSEVEKLTDFLRDFSKSGSH